MTRVLTLAGVMGVLGLLLGLALAGGQPAMGDRAVAAAAPQTAAHCPACGHEHARAHGGDLFACDDCGGTGWRTCGWCGGDGIRNGAQCTFCNGRGQLKCVRCGGTGK